MSTEWITRLPPEVLFVIIGSVDNPADLLAFALTCRFIYDIVIISDYLSYFRIASWMGDVDLWKHLSQNLPLCRKTREFMLTDGTSFVSRRPMVRVYGRPNKSINDSTISSNLPIILRHMVNLRRAKLWQLADTNFEVIRGVLEALVDSRCRLEEFDLFLTIPHSFGSTLMTEAAREPKTLQIWSKINLAALQKLSICIVKISTGINWNTELSTLSREVNSIVNMLSNASALTHLNLTVRDTITVRANLFEFTCPNLENLMICIIGRLEANMSQDPFLFDFFKRHPRLTTLSLPSNVYTPTFSPYITLHSLPKLESLAYNAPVRVPLSHVLSPASARRLRHLTISDQDASFRNSDMGIYRELTSLQSCCLTSDTSSYHDNFNQILANFVTHATNLKKIHLPILRDQNLQEPLYVKTISILKCLPQLTHLSGISLWTGSPSPGLLRELYRFSQLKYVTTPSPQSPPHRTKLSVFQLIRNDKTVRMWVVSLKGKNPGCDMMTWGNFYKGMEI